MFAVYAAEPNADAPLDSLTVGERPAPEVPAGWVAVTVTAASLSENAVGIRLLDHASRTYPTISKSWVDTGFKNAVIEHGANLGIDVEVVNRNPGVRGFHVVKRRWVVERSIGWIMTHRRLARDYETLPTSSKAMIQIASIDNLARRITDETTPTWRGTY